MSRSYKKNPIVKDNCNYSKLAKRKASRRLRAMLKRNPEVIGNHNCYRKNGDTWEIHDYKSRMTEQEAIETYKTQCNEDAANNSTWTVDRWPTLKDYLRWWRTVYKNK